MPRRRTKQRGMPARAGTGSERQQARKDLSPRDGDTNCPEHITSSARSGRRLCRRERLADRLRELDDDPLWAADVTESVNVPVLLHRADEVESAGPHALDRGIYVVDPEGEVT